MNFPVNLTFQLYSFSVVGILFHSFSPAYYCNQFLLLPFIFFLLSICHIFLSFFFFSIPFFSSRHLIQLFIRFCPQLFQREWKDTKWVIEERKRERITFQQEKGKGKDCCVVWEQVVFRNKKFFQHTMKAGGCCLSDEVHHHFALSKLSFPYMNHSSIHHSSIETRWRIRKEGKARIVMKGFFWEGEM